MGPHVSPAVSPAGIADVRQPPPQPKPHVGTHSPTPFGTNDGGPVDRLLVARQASTDTPQLWQGSTRNRSSSSVTAGRRRLFTAVLLSGGSRVRRSRVAGAD